MNTDKTMSISRRAFVGAMAALPALGADSDWTPLFNGRDFENWRPSEHKDSWHIREGEIVADGARSHLFYTGPVQGAMFKNFDLEVECLARPECNSGVYFHTAYQETGFPVKGFEIQINNTFPGEGAYRERKKTGSLYGLRNIYKQFIPDDTWFKISVAVRGKSVKIRVNDMLVVDYVEPTPPVIPPGMERERFLDRGTFALQCHNQGSVARFRSVRVRPAADDAGSAEPAPEVDETFRQIINVGRSNIPVVDYHVHLKNGLTLEQAMARSRRDGIHYGIAVNVGKLSDIKDDAGAIRFVESLKGQPCFVGMQAEGREWTEMFTRKSTRLFDYVFSDSETWTDRRGRRMRLWIPEEVGTIADVPEFMETLVERTVGIIEKEPIDIYANPTFLPAQIAKDYDTLWTEERMKKVVDAAARSRVAIELNDRYKLPGPAFVKMAKAAGCKFSFGTNNTGPGDLRRSEYGLRMVQECRLGWQDFFVPGAWWPKAAERS
jgi:3-keto-disaccharide hydrolase